MTFSSDPINTLENLDAKNKTKSFSIYLAIILALITILFLLPIIKIDISTLLFLRKSQLRNKILN